MESEAHYHFQKIPSLVHILSHKNPLHAIPLHFFKISLILSSHSSLGLTRGPFLHAWISFLSRMCQMSHPSHPSCCYHPNDMVSNLYYVAPHYVKIFRTRSNCFSDTLLPLTKCFLSYHLSAELWHALSEKQYHTSELPALHITSYK